VLVVHFYIAPDQRSIVRYFHTHIGFKMTCGLKKYIQPGLSMNARACGVQKVRKCRINGNLVSLSSLLLCMQDGQHHTLLKVK